MSEAKANGYNSPVGLFCFKSCKKFKFLSRKCKQWNYDVKNFSETGTFNMFKSAGFIFRARRPLVRK